MSRNILGYDKEVSYELIYSPSDHTRYIIDPYTCRIRNQIPFLPLVDCFPNPNAKYASLDLTSGLKTPI
jgi:hypothetical protein